MQENENTLWGIVLISTTMKEYSEEQIETDIPKRIELRKANQVTGLSIFAGGNVLMQIEGRRENVYEQFELIKKYAGHHSIIKLYDGALPYRFFEAYPMAFKAIYPENLKRFNTFKTDEEKEYFNEFLSTKHIVPRIVANFIKNNL